MKEKPTDKRSICVFCGSSQGRSPAYEALATATGEEIGVRGYRLVYGGGGAGLMGAAARGALRKGGPVLGIIPEFLMTPERAMSDIDQRIVPNMHERKMQMFDASDAFIVLPGGIGTIEEAVEVLCWMRLQIHQKPILFLSPDNYWDPLLGFIKQTIESRFSPDWILDDVLKAENAKDALMQIEAAWDQPPKDIKPITSVSNKDS